MDSRTSVTEDVVSREGLDRYALHVVRPVVTCALMGPNFWPYGIEANRTILSLLLGYAHRHGTVERDLAETF